MNDAAVKRMRELRDRNEKYYTKMGEVGNSLTDDEKETILTTEEIQRMMEQSGGCPYNSGMIRNPERIDLICDALKSHWHDCPDQRLGQVVMNLLQCDDPFYREDNAAMKSLDIDFTEPYWVYLDQDSE